MHCISQCVLRTHPNGRQCQCEGKGCVESEGLPVVQDAQPAAAATHPSKYRSPRRARVRAAPATAAPGLDRGHTWDDVAHTGYPPLQGPAAAPRRPVRAGSRIGTGARAAPPRPPAPAATPRARADPAPRRARAKQFGQWLSGCQIDSITCTGGRDAWALSKMPALASPVNRVDQRTP